MSFAMLKSHSTGGLIAHGTFFCQHDISESVLICTCQSPMFLDEHLLCCYIFEYSKIRIQGACPIKNQEDIQLD